MCLQWTEAGASGASGQRVVQTVRCGGAGSAPNPHLAPGAKNARGSTSSLSTVPASSAHRVSALPPTYIPQTILSAVQLRGTIEKMQQLFWHRIGRMQFSYIFACYKDAEWQMAILKSINVLITFESCSHLSDKKKNKKHNTKAKTFIKHNKQISNNTWRAGVRD